MCQYRSSLLPLPQYSERVAIAEVIKREASGQHRPCGEEQEVVEGLSADEVAELLALSRATVYRLIQERKLGHVRISNAVMVHVEQLRAYVQANVVTVDTYGHLVVEDLHESIGTLPKLAAIPVGEVSTGSHEAAPPPSSPLPRTALRSSPAPAAG